MNTIPDYLMATSIAIIIGYIVVAFVLAYCYSRAAKRIAEAKEKIDRLQHEIQNYNEVIDGKLNQNAGLMVSATEKLRSIENGTNQILSTADHQFRQIIEGINQLKPKRDNHGRFSKSGQAAKNN